MIAVVTGKRNMLNVEVIRVQVASARNLLAHHIQARVVMTEMCIGMTVAM